MVDLGSFQRDCSSSAPWLVHKSLSSIYVGKSLIPWWLLFVSISGWYHLLLELRCKLGYCSLTKIKFLFSLYLKVFFILFFLFILSFCSVTNCLFLSLASTITSYQDRNFNFMGMLRIVIHWYTWNIMYSYEIVSYTPTPEARPFGIRELKSELVRLASCDLVL